MASHDVALKVATELPVGAVDLEIPVKRNGRKIGTFTVNANGVSWNPSTSKAPTSVSWEELPAALSSTAAPAEAAPAKKAAPAAKKTTAKKTTAKKAAPAEAPEAETAPEVTEAPAPAKRASGRKSAEKSAPAAKKSAPAAKKSAPAAKKSAPAAVDARAVRQWAAENGITVAPRGPISTSIIDQFRAATA
ncbi:Lsr2 family protein [Paenibacillus sp. TRM 82003]|uniref:Lsr2 family DNA-binding protein n=1 Tax=Kineococcus sp. TRM81007 TaxID=2925831 RepID=UPI001F56AE8F|nr:histone-like nucleoid-structuring protein Lsr2 [Kineococcus sp. TRM81007]MCI2239496.1 Lsr2 family protein [Kineococcus sp. TRM81007]MCI3919297.1 Lsr2 family protein [Paenibacillus sp. TRM 82003]